MTLLTLFTTLCNECLPKRKRRVGMHAAIRAIPASIIYQYMIVLMVTLNIEQY